MAIRTYRLYALCCRRTPIGKLLLFLWTPVRGVIATLLKSASVPPTIRRVHTFVHVHLHIAHMSLLGCAHVRMCHVFIDACAHLCAYRTHLTSMRCIFVHEWVGVYIYMCIGICTGMYIDVCIGKCTISILFAYAVGNAVSHPINHATAQHAPSSMHYESAC